MEALFEVRPVSLHEPAHRAALLSLLDHYARDPMGGGVPLSAYAREHLVAGLRTRSSYAGFLAWRGDLAVGLLNAFEGYSTFRAQPLLNIHDLVVQSNARGRGVGQQLLRAAQHEAERRGCCKLTLEVLSNNLLARKAYERFGFAAYVLEASAGHALFLEKKL